MGWFRMPRFGYKLQDGQWFEKIAKNSFNEVDVDKDGALDEKELFIGLLRLYDILNSALPCHVKVPRLHDIYALMKEYDTDKSGKINFEEFLKLARGMVGTRKTWRRSLLLKIGTVVVLKTAVFPMTALLLKEVAFPWLPRGIATFALETGFKKVVPGVM